MDIISLLKEKINENKIFVNEEMSKYTSFKTGGKADILVKINNIDEMKFVLEISKKYDIPLFILGNGSNILVTDKGIRGIVCKIEITKFEVTEVQDEIFVTVGSGEKNGNISQKLLKMGIAGFEFASRNSWNNWWSNKNECWSIWKRNERYCFI